LDHFAPQVAKFPLPLSNRPKHAPAASHARGDRVVRNAIALIQSRFVDVLPLLGVKAVNTSTYGEGPYQVDVSTGLYPE
jgi:hypothetical protein